MGTYDLMKDSIRAVCVSLAVRRCQDSGDAVICPIILTGYPVQKDKPADLMQLLQVPFQALDLSVVEKNFNMDAKAEAKRKVVSFY